MGSSGQGKTAATSREYERAHQDERGYKMPDHPHLGQPVRRPGCCGWTIRRVEQCCCCAIFSVLVIVVAWWFYGNWLAKITLVSAGSHVTGVNVSVASTWIAALSGQLIVTNVTVANPSDIFSISPFFLNCKTAYVDINWKAIISSFSGLVKIDELTVLGLIMYLDTEHFHSNMEIIMKNIGENPVVKFATEHKNENQRFMIKKVKVQDLQVHTVVGGLLVPLVKVPPLEVDDIGVKQNGVSVETLVGLLIQSFVLEAVQHKVTQMETSVDKSLQDLAPKKANDL